jgi:hypothetical protein
VKQDQLETGHQLCLVCSKEPVIDDQAQLRSTLSPVSARGEIEILVDQVAKMIVARKPRERYWLSDPSTSVMHARLIARRCSELLMIILEMWVYHHGDRIAALACLLKPSHPQTAQINFRLNVDQAGPFPTTPCSRLIVRRAAGPRMIVWVATIGGDSLSLRRFHSFLNAVSVVALWQVPVKRIMRLFR